MRATVTKENQENAAEFFHVKLTNTTGSVRVRRNGKTKTWKTRPLEFQIPVKYGLRDCFYITQHNAKEWEVEI